MTHQGARGDDMDSSWPSGGGATAVAGPPTAPVAAAAGASALTVGSIATVACTLVIFVVIAAGLVSLQYFFDVRDDDDRGSRRGGRVPWRRRGGGDGIRAANRGVDPELLRSLPVTVYRAATPGSGKEEDAVECAVCLAELEDGEAARFLPRCGHGFHAACVDTWLASHTTCPLCRLTVAKPDASPSPALALLPVPPEPANYDATANMPASVLFGVSGNGAVVAAETMASYGDTGVLVIEVPELAEQTPTPRGAAKSPGSARLRSSFRRLWSFGKQGAGPSSSRSCGEGADVEQGVSVTIGKAVAEP